MKLTEWLDKNSWNQFVAGNSWPASFLQSWEWGEFQKSQGHQVLRLGFIPAQTREHEVGQLLAAASLIKRCFPIPGMCYWYCPRGPVIKKDNLGSQETIIQHLVNELAGSKEVFLRVVPYWEPKLDKTHWADLGFSQPKLLLHQQEPAQTWLTHLQDSDKLLQKMHQKTRYNIRLAERKGVKFKFYDTDSDLGDFDRLLRATAKREKIKVYKKDYYTVLMIATRLVTKPKAQLSKSEVRGILGLASYQGRVIVAGLWLGFGNNLTYLHGGSSREHRQVMAPNWLHWQIMQWGHDKGYSYYDWWGIESNEKLKMKNEKSLAGVTRFKKGFGGQAFTYANTHDFVFSQKKFKYLNALKKMRDLI
jgi:peptidoglycan pentaglycine glycine transferase (the first glycine)